MAGRKAGWDTQYGYELYLQGKTDAEIADECRVQTGTVTSYRLKRWRKNPDGGRPPSEGSAELGGDSDPGTQNSELTDKEVKEMPVEKDNRADVARMMEVIAKMTQGMGGIKAVCVGNIIQSLWNLNCVDDIREARNILDWLEENYEFG